MLSSIMLVVVAFIFLTREMDWNYVSDLYKDKDEPATLIMNKEQIVETEHLEIAVSLDDKQFERLEKLIQQVEDVYPYIMVTITNYFSDNYQYEDWENKAKLDQLGDAQLIRNEWILPLAIQGFLQPVDRLMSSDTLANLLPGYTDALKWNGYMWGVPYSNNPYVIFSQRLVQEHVEVVTTNNELDAITEEDQAVFAEEIATNETEVISNWDRMQEVYASESSDESVTDIHLLNLVNGSYESMLVWLTYWNLNQESGMTTGHLTEEQRLKLHWLAEQDAIQQENSLYESSIATEQWPLYYMTTWNNFSLHREEIAGQYDTTSIEVPVPWLNGYSFVIQANSKKATAAILWIEKLTQYASANASQYNESPTRNMDFMLGSNLEMSELGFLLNQKLSESQMLNVSPYWAKEYATLQQQWSSIVDLSDKLQTLQ